MALAEIQKHIQTKADEQIAKIQAASSKQVKESKVEWEKKLVDERERVLAEINRNADSKLTQAKFKIRERVNAEKLKAKQAQIDQVYNQALQSLSELSDADYTELMVKLLEGLKGTEGSLSTCTKRKAQLEDALSKAGLKAEIKDDLQSVGGFVFHTEATDIDNTFETLIDQTKERTLIDVHSKLFNL
tara:strand:+ start:222 stop:785 length:564 start_codon:yes stop_codon:yes gene_type:complete